MSPGRPPPRLTSGVDPLTADQRRLNMSRIRAKDTKPEMLLRRALHARGLRYRLHGAKLPGKPDLVFPARRVVVFVHGCFWHGHDCPLFRIPATRTAFWSAKIAENRVRDTQAVNALVAAGWRIQTVWECALRGRARRSLPEVADATRDFVLGEQQEATIEGHWEGPPK